MNRRVRVGVVGCGLVAQVMHLPYLRELSDRFEVAALCDVSPKALEAGGSVFPDAYQHRHWPDLLNDKLDSVFVLTAGSHSPISVAAAEVGLEIFVEKPLALSEVEGQLAVDAAAHAGVRLMVGYMKRFDPAFEHLAGEFPFDEIRLARVTTLESPLEPYLSHYSLTRSDDVDADIVAELRADEEGRVTAAIQTDNPVLRRAYREILLDSMVHELNGVRALLGEPDLLFADVWGAPSGVTATLAFGHAEAIFSWVDLPGITAYEQDWTFYAPSMRASLRFPAPFLRNAPTQLVLEGGPVGSPASWRSEHIVGYEEAFKRELVEFHEAIVQDREPRTPGSDATRDLALCEKIIENVLMRSAQPLDSARSPTGP